MMPSGLPGGPEADEVAALTLDLAMKGASSAGRTGWSNQVMQSCFVTRRSRPVCHPRKLNTNGFARCHTCIHMDMNIILNVCVMHPQGLFWSY